MCRYPFGSGGKRVMICLYFPARTSSATMSRIKSEGLPVSVVIVIDKNIGEGPNRQLHCALKFRTFSLTPCFSEVLRDSAQRQTASAVFLDGCGKPPKRLRRHGLLPAPS